MDEILEKAIIKAIFKTGRMLVYRKELELPEDYEIKDNGTYIFRYDEDDSDFDIFTHPDLIQLDNEELNVFNEIFRY